MKKMKRLLALVLALCLALSVAVTTSFAAEGDSTEEPVVVYGTDAFGSSVTIAGESAVYYDVYGANGTILTVKGETAYVIYNGETYKAVNGEVAVLVTSEWMMAPVSFAIGNSGTSEATYTVEFAIPLGDYSNPEVVTSGTVPFWSVSLAEGDSNGYNLKYVAETDGLLVITKSSSEYNVSLTNNTTWQQTNNSSNSLPLPIAMSKGDEIMINVCAIMDMETYTYPAADVIVAYQIITDNTETPINLGSAAKYVGELYSESAYVYTGRYDSKTMVLEAKEGVVVNYGGVNYTVGSTGKTSFEAVADDYGYVTFTVSNPTTGWVEFTLSALDLCTCGNELEYNAAVEAVCHQNGSNEYWYCSKCDVYYSDAAATQITNVKNEVVLAPVALTYMPAVKACHQNGSSEYWFCSECQAVFADAAGTMLTNRQNLTIPAVLELTHVATVAATCHQNGSAEYWYCEDCDAVYTDADGKYLTNRKNLTIPATVGLTYMPRIEPCHQNGSAEYWFCSECQAVFSDAAGTMLTNRPSLTLPADCELVFVAASEATCHQNGYYAHWYCPECKAVFTDADGKYLTNMKNLVAEEAEPLTHVEKVEATCHQNGCEEYWYCEECEAVFADSTGTQLTNRKNLTIAAEPLVHMEAVEACHQNGVQEYWFCAECQAVFSDAAGRYLTNRMNLVVLADCELVHVEAVKATCTKNGSAEYWYCPECEGVFSDADGRYLTNRMNLVVEATGHNYVKGECTVCGEDESPKTGDVAPVMSVIALGMAAAAAFVLLNKKRQA